MVVGTCRLCLGEGLELQESHYLSKGIYKIMRDDDLPNPNPWVLTRGDTVQSSKQLTATLLCRGCEQRLNKKGENWVLANCLRNDGRFRLASILASKTPDVSSPANPTRLYYAAKIPEVNSSALAYFAASIFWRGSLYPWNEDGTVPIRLGPFQEAFRKYLMGEADFPKDCALMVAIREGKEIDRLTSAPAGKRGDIGHVHKFAMPGFAFTMAVGKNIPANIRDCCFVHNPVHPIIATTLFEQWLVQDAIRMRMN